jgi:hypothetical protein
VKSTTVGADVFVNGRRVGMTPLKRKIRLRSGTHTIRLAKLGYSDYLDTVKIRRGRRTTVSIDLVELKGILRVGSNPGNAEVILNGRFFGRTPLREELSPGRYGLEVRRMDYRAFVADFDIDAGEERRFNPTLEIEREMVIKPKRQWYENEWVWISVASAVVVTGVIAAIAINTDEPQDTVQNDIGIMLTQ